MISDKKTSPQEINIAKEKLEDSYELADRSMFQVLNHDVRCVLNSSIFLVLNKSLGLWFFN